LFSDQIFVFGKNRFTKLELSEKSEDVNMKRDFTIGSIQSAKGKIGKISR
jgi:hypothetical protein